jgi:hypothetical protein
MKTKTPPPLVLLTHTLPADWIAALDGRVRARLAV